jgi:hypothetical protein
MKNSKQVLTVSILSTLLSIASSYGANIDQRTNDITVLQIWTGSEIYSKSEEGGSLDLSQCKGTQGNPYLNLDCAAAVQALLKNSSDSATPALATAFGFPSQGGVCETWEIRTVTKLSAFNSPTFTGIGFSLERGSYSGANEGLFIPKAELDQVGVTVTLKDGEPAIVHRFVAQGACNANGDDGYSLEFSMIKFRPYARFNTATDQYTNWDSVASDYQVGAIYNSSSISTFDHVNSFDRQNDVLK